MHFRLACLICLAFVVGCAHTLAPTPSSVSSASSLHSTVVWISIDGFRHDYMARFHPPTLERLASQGAFTTQETPIFPSLTFPNHVAQVTGVGVDGHGIPMNSFYDEADGTTYNFPDPSRLLRAEPIWATATRQGLRVACIDWPLSSQQTGPYAAAKFNVAFDSQETDRHRLDRILDVLKTDPDPAHPYRLVLGYMANVDHTGHQNGPDSPEIAAAVAAADADIEHFLSQLIPWFESTHSSDDDLVVIFSTDHGMTAVKVQVSLDRLIGADLVSDKTQIVTSGPVATIHCPPERTDEIVTRLKNNSFLNVWKAGDVPAADHFSDPSRIGQVVVMLKLGYSFTKQRLAAIMPARGSTGMHGYDPSESPDLQGSAVIWRLKNPIGGHDLGPMVNTQWDATVCKMLGIHPPATADARAVAVP